MNETLESVNVAELQDVFIQTRTRYHLNAQIVDGRHR